MFIFRNKMDCQIITDEAIDIDDSMIKEEIEENENEDYLNESEDDEQENENNEKNTEDVEDYTDEEQGNEKIKLY